MRIIFAGTPRFATYALEALIDAGHDIVAVYCQPDRGKGRGRKITQCAVKEYAVKHGLKVMQPISLLDLEVQQEIINAKVDIMVVVAYGQLLPSEILSAPKYGCVNIHASNLPRWRGAAPIVRAILAGDKSTAISIMQMDSGLDTGAVLLTQACQISADDDANSLHDKLANLGAKAIVEALSNTDNLTPKTQSIQGVSYAKKITKIESWINWNQSASVINQQIRAFNPYPIAQTYARADKFDERILRIFKAKVIFKKSIATPGSIIDCDKNSCLVATKDNILSLEIVQLSGKKALNIKDFVNAHTLIKLS